MKNLKFLRITAIFAIIVIGIMLSMRFFKQTTATPPTPLSVLVKAPPSSHDGAQIAMPSVSNGAQVAMSSNVAKKSSEPESSQLDAKQRDLRADHAASLGIVSSIYETFLSQQKLSQQQRDQLLELTCEERQATYDVIATARQNGINYRENAEVERLALAAATGEDQDIERLLGPDAFASFLNYRATQTIRTTVSNLNDTLSGQGQQLTDSQMTQLVNVFLEAQDADLTRRAPIKAVLQLSGAAVTEQVIKQSQSILSPPQLSALVQIRANQLAGSNRVTIGSQPQQ